MGVNIHQLKQTVYTFKLILVFLKTLLEYKAKNEINAP